MGSCGVWIGMKRLVALTFTTVLITLVGGATTQQPAAAGGWAITTLDEYPTPVAGAEIAVGFTILQHGVTPADMEPTEKVGLEITAASGGSEYFPAVKQGAVGHYVATVVLAEAGAHTWTAYQGWFAPQELGPLTVEPSSGGSASSGSATAASSSESSAPAWLRYGLPALAAILGAYALFDAFTSRRRSALA